MATIYTYEIARNLFIEDGYIPLFKKYKNLHERMPCETKDGYKFVMSLYQLKRKKKTPIFHVSNPFTIDNIRHYISLNNIDCKLLSDIYQSSDRHKLDFKCKCGSKFTITWNEFYSRGKTYCDECGVKKRSGVNHYDYNPTLTDDERIRRRIITPNENMRVFRNQVFERDDYTCQCCGDKSTKGTKVILNAHHLDGYHWCEEKRFNPENGITLCKVCHEAFHKIYGRKNNTRLQFNEFMNQKTHKKGSVFYFERGEKIK